MAIIYDLGQNEDKNFIIAEDCLDKQNLGKCETIMAQGNGYLGLRNSLEEKYVKQTRGLFIAGTFNKFYENEVTELPNAADVVGVDMFLDGQSIEELKTIDYKRSLNLRTGLSLREIEVSTKDSKRYKLKFERIVSFKNLHLIAQKISVTPLDCDLHFEFSTGIDGQMTNSSVQHFSEGTKRLYDKEYMEAVFTTTESQIHFLFHTIIKTNDESVNSQIQMDRRKIFKSNEVHIKMGKTFIFEKFTTVYTSRDLEFAYVPLDEMKSICLNRIKLLNKNFDYLYEESASSLFSKYYEKCNIKLESKNDFDELAIHFSIYHLASMAPYEDSRMSIAAKGLTGEGYKGHVFWDCEVFCLPFFLYEKPNVARRLLEYRYYTLPGARKKSSLNGYRGAQYPWESAWIDDGETTPVWGAADIITGKPIKIESGFIQLHITSVVANAVKQYYEITSDLDFMIKYGFQIIFETAEFWCSRFDYNAEKDRYELNDVMGPDEYKEHINNDAFTNYMAKYNLQLALDYYDLFKQNSSKNYDDLIA
ncbi:MAG: glycoside hydrolase family 65 protein, partial [Oscillospiraceae bacterium]|nr:glycoside hydrolase family 65 protein [Oscillospiraceae bacterium]